MQDSRKVIAEKLGLDLEFIEKKTNTSKNTEVLGNDLTFIDIREFERTKHVHRLHPYLGKFIPQLVEVFISKYFKENETIIDPFSGSGTTLIEANILGINSIGIELSPFNVLIQKVKANKYDTIILEKEIISALKRVQEFSKQFIDKKQATLFSKKNECFNSESEYLKNWFSSRALQEILFYRSIIEDYNNQDVLKVILSRAARSARLITHYDLARPKKPTKETYWCIKHKRYCTPIDEALKFIKRYSLDTIKRIKIFGELRTNSSVNIYQGDARYLKLSEKMKIDGVFTSPPYVGIIDYHEQHKYAYELFNFSRFDDLEIGSAKNKQNKNSQREYVKGIVSVFKNVSKYLKEDATILIVANDKYNLYTEIGEQCNFKLVDVFHRPVLMRTERDSNKYFESIFYFKKE